MPASVARVTRSARNSKAPSATQIGMVVASNVALATVVPRIARCQKNRSPANRMPVRMMVRSKGVSFCSETPSPAALRSATSPPSKSDVSDFDQVLVPNSGKLEFGGEVDSWHGIATQAPLPGGERSAAKRPGEGVSDFRSHHAHTHKNGSARNTRQNALACGPTSAQRTKIGDAPMKTAPSASAENAITARGTARSVVSVPSAAAIYRNQLCTYDPH